MQLKVGVG